MKNLLNPALGALLLGLLACAGPSDAPEGGAEEGVRAAVESAELPELRYYMIADA